MSKLKKMVKASDRISVKDPIKDPIVDQILDDLDIEMSKSKDNCICVYTNEFYKKYKISRLSKKPKEQVDLFRDIKRMVLIKLRTLGYDVRVNVQDQYYVSW